MKRKSLLFFISLISLAIIVSGCGINKPSTSSASNEEGIKVGILFSLGGTTALIEEGMANAALLAIEEINAAGGVNGKELIPVQEDYSSDPSEAASKVRKLIMQDEVAAVVGGYSSASRQAMLPIVEDNNSVLVYPTYFEGEEYSKNIIYTGTTPNQNLQNFIPWATEKLGKKVYFIGSDYVYPVQTNKQALKLLALDGGESVGEQYVPLGHSEFSSILNDIRKADPDFIFSTLIGDSVAAFYSQYADYGFKAEEMPILSPATAEPEVNAMSPEVAAGHYSSHAYFETIDTPENKKFIESYKSKYGDDEPLHVTAEAAYISVHLLAKAMEKVENPYDSEALLVAFNGIEYDAPQGKVKIDENNHTWLNVRIAQIGKNRDFQTVVESEEAIKPEPWSKLLYPDHEEPWKK